MYFTIWHPLLPIKDRENQELQRSIMDLQELVAGFQSGAIYQRLVRR